jgi:hypothetical protein
MLPFFYNQLFIPALFFYKVYPSDFTILTAPERLRNNSDIRENILKAKIDWEYIVSGDIPRKVTRVEPVYIVDQCIGIIYTKH